MAVTPSGTISLADINTATGSTSTTQISLGGTAGRCLSNTAEGAAVSMSQLRSKTCAGGTITVGTQTTTAKGVTTTRYGKSTWGGSITLGNMTSFPNLQNATDIVFIVSSSSSSSFQTWSGNFDIAVSQIPPYLPTTRIKAGSNVMSTFNTVTTINSNLINPIQQRTPTGVLGAADVGKTIKWVIAQG